MADEELTPEEWPLAAWAERDPLQERDDMVRTALANGISKNRIHKLTGIARTTIDRIIAGQEADRG
jgi:DNA invertase Pin-like site-specific DNA recombinase